MTGSKGGREELLDVLRALARQLAALQRRLSKAEESADRIAADLLWLVEAMEWAPRTRPLPRRPPCPSAHAAAIDLDLKARPDGSVTVRIDFGKAFELPPALGDLLETLAQDSGRSGDEFVGWKSLDEVAILLAKRSHHKFTRHAVTQQVHRLRKELFQRGGVNPALVQTNRRYGLRIALKRRRGTVIEDDRG